LRKPVNFNTLVQAIDVDWYEENDRDVMGDITSLLEKMQERKKKWCWTIFYPTTTD
jgi:hypothetical protein